MSSEILHNTQHWLEGWDETHGIVSVNAMPNGVVQVWRRVTGDLRLETEHFTPWVYAKNLESHWGKQGLQFLELPGSGTFKYLVSHQNWLHLRRVLNLSRENPNFYAVGLNEQYLMTSGRTFFKGLEFADLKRLQFDLETTALKPEDGQIFLIAVRDSSGFEMLLEGQEADLINDLLSVITAQDPDVIENHNLNGFDLPFLEARAAIHKIALKMGRTSQGLRREGERYSVPGRELIDTLDAVWRHDFVVRELPSHRLKDVARHYGLSAPNRVYLEGSSIAMQYELNPDLVRAYALEDVREVDRLSQKLMPASFALSKLAPRRFERISSAGTATGILEPMLVRAYHHAGRALPSSDCVYLEKPHEGGAVFLFQTGLAKNVVKADIASLYPSVMRAFEIGSSCDELGVLLSLVKQMLERRLEHKRLAKLEKITHQAATQGTHHDAMQAALKLVLNSAYGYLGAGQMALFADRKAADKITQTGRDILQNVITQLRQANVNLLEADTDGFFFATSLNQAEARVLVKQISDSLPQGITLEFDDLYTAMLSHDIKNYALLRQDGTVQLRGVNFRSSRFEPAMQAFTEQIVQAALENQPLKMQTLYLEIRRKIETRGFSAKDLATRVRLRKTMQEYQSSRHKLREAAYEAMLEAGRTWHKGERIRLYRRQHGFGILPADEGSNALEQAKDYQVQHYLQLLDRVYVKKLERACSAAQFAQIFSNGFQAELFFNQLELTWLL
jgi:DNA polymerase, archaea type